MTFEQSMTTAQNDLAGFRDAQKLMPDYWVSFNETLENLLPLVKRWHQSGEQSLPSIDKIAQAMAYSEDRLTDIFKALTYLSGDGVKMLEHYFEYRDDVEIFPVSGSEALSVMDGGDFLYPETHAPVNNPKTKIHMGFRFRDSLL